MRDILEIKGNSAELLQLVKENPDLPVLPAVSYEVSGGDWGHWFGAWGKAEIREVVWKNEEIIFRDDIKSDEMWELIARIDENFHDTSPDAYFGKDEEVIVMAYYDALPWQRVIVVYIETP